MKEEYQKYLPLGSIVRLKNATKRVMIIGYVQIDINNINQIYDYAGCLYPEGVMKSDTTVLFNHEDIERIYCIGYKDEEQTEWMNKVKEMTSEENIKIMIEKAKRQQNDINA